MHASTRRIRLFIAIGIIIPSLTAAQQQGAPEASVPVIRFAPSAAQQIPPGSASASPEQRRTMEALRMEPGETIGLDGVLDEDVWMRAVPAMNFVQREPLNGRPATEQTEVRIVYDRDTLYIGVSCFDSEPDKVIANQMARDGFMFADDQFQWVIDTFLDGRTGYFFEMNPLGAMGDGLQGVDSQNRQWDGIWDARARRSEMGWTLEIAIPFRTLNFNADSDTWGINFQRNIRQKNNEESLWMGWPRNQGLRRMSNTGLLTGIRDVTQGRGLDITPYALGTAFQGGDQSRAARQLDAGVDLSYSITPQLQAKLTVNTDFAQTEVDQRQVNLTRFSLFFPEKRDFFLDGALFFDFASGSTGGGFDADGGNSDLLPFFSRRIGLTADGSPQRIDFGTKLLGQIGEFDVGFLQVRTGKEDATPGENFVVGRVKRRILRQSYIGALYTRRDGGIGNRQTIGADVRLATNTFRGRQNLSLSAYLLHTTNPLEAGKGSAFGADVRFPNDPWFGSLAYTEVQDNYDAAVGFTRRTGFRKIQPRIGFAPRPGSSWIRRFNFSAEVDWRLDPDTNRTLTREIDIRAFDLFTHSQDNIRFHIVPTYERLERAFKIAPHITLPAGQAYGFTRYRIQAGTADRRLLAARPRVEWGSFFSGDRLELEMNVSVRPRPGLVFTLAEEWNRVSLAEGRFYTRLHRVVAEVQLSPFASVANNVQYDSQGAVLGWQSRFRWTIRPGNDIFFVYVHNWTDDPSTGRLSTLERRATSKIAYTHRF